MVITLQRVECRGVERHSEAQRRDRSVDHTQLEVSARARELYPLVVVHPLGRVGNGDWRAVLIVAGDRHLAVVEVILRVREGASPVDGLNAKRSSDVELVVDVHTEREFDFANRATAALAHRVAHCGVDTHSVGVGPIHIALLAFGVQQPAVICQNATPIVCVAIVVVQVAARGVGEYSATAELQREGIDDRTQ